jgi:hypothetical protein
VGVGFRPNPEERTAGASAGLSTGYPQTQSYPQVIHQISTGQNRCVKATLKKDLVDNRVKGSEITVESHSVITVYTAVEQSLFTVESQ